MITLAISHRDVLAVAFLETVIRNLDSGVALFKSPMRRLVSLHCAKLTTAFLPWAMVPDDPFRPPLQHLGLIDLTRLTSAIIAPICFRSVSERGSLQWGGSRVVMIRNLGIELTWI